MMNKLLGFLIFSLINTSLWACEVELPSHLVILGESVDFKNAIKQHGCTDKDLEEVSKTIGSVEGKITSLHFAEILKSKNVDAVVRPHLLNVQHLKHLVREQLHLPPGIQLRSSEAVNCSNYLTVAPGDRVEVGCVGCLYGSQQPLNLKIVGFDGSNKSYLIKADFKKMVRAYRLIGSQTSFSELTPDKLKEEYVESIPHTDLISDLKNIRFYKLNKPVRAGELLKQSDLNAISLVKAGLTTEVIIENSLVRLKTHGISRSNGSLGELVEVFHPEKKKKYQGKVIDINKVLVEL